MKYHANIVIVSGFSNIRIVAMGGMFLASYA